MTNKQFAESLIPFMHNYERAFEFSEPVSPDIEALARPIALLLNKHGVGDSLLVRALNEMAVS